MNVRSCYYRELSIVISVPPRAPSPGGRRMTRGEGNCHVAIFRNSGEKKAGTVGSNSKESQQIRGGGRR